jgi:hypothetical protein
VNSTAAATKLARPLGAGTTSPGVAVAALLLIIVAIPDHFFPSRSNHHSRTGAARGNVQAARELADRTEGKASQHLEVAGNDYGVYREFSGKRCQVNSKVWIFPASGVGGVASTIRVPSNLIVRIKSVSTQFCMEDIST